MSNTVIESRQDAIAILRLNRPEKLNALNYELVDALLSALDRIEADPALRAIILTGAGDRAFSAGADIPEFAGSISHGVDTALRLFVRRGQALTSRIETFPKPIIVAVNGLAYGGGCEITEAAGLSIASDRARFAKPEVAIGIPPTFGGTQRLPRLAGRKRALELLLTGMEFGPERALELGLVNQVVPHDDLMAASLDLARRILEHAPEPVSAILRAVAHGLNAPIAEGLRIEGEQFARVAETPNTWEALSAWMDRRPPSYRSPI